MKPCNQKCSFSEMVEAMVEQTPEYYKKYRIHFRYVISFTKPTTEIMGNQNYAFGLHSEEQDAFCPISEPHYHFLTEVDKKSSKTHGYPISCLYSTYFYLLFKSDSLEKCGEIIQKLDGAIYYNLTLGENSFFKQPKKKQGENSKSESESRNCSTDGAHVSASNEPNRQNIRQSSGRSFLPSVGYTDGWSW